MLELGLKTLVAYLLGSVMGALVVGSTRGVDIREEGSGNPGGTNALRTRGAWFAAGTVLIDVGKGWLAAGWVPGMALGGTGTDPAIDGDWLVASCAAAVVVGHVWPVFYGFRGGKGGATLAGVLLVLAPAVAAVAIGAWLLVAALAGFVALATVAAAAVAPFALGLIEPDRTALVIALAGIAALVLYAHRGNLARIRRREEPRLRRILPGSRPR